MVSAAIGWRYLAEGHAIYFTPKIGAIECLNLPF